MGYSKISIGVGRTSSLDRIRRFGGLTQGKGGWHALMTTQDVQATIRQSSAHSHVARLSPTYIKNTIDKNYRQSSIPTLRN